MTDEIARLVELSGRATRGEWRSWVEPNYCAVTTAMAQGTEFPIVSTGADDANRIDVYFIAALVNWFRAHQEELKEGRK